MRFETFVRDVRKALESVDGDLLVENGTVDAPKAGLQVSGLTKCRGYCRFNGDVFTSELEAHIGEVLVEGSLTAERLVKTRGPLRVEGDLKADRVEVHKHADVGGGLSAHEVSVGGSLTVNGIAKAHRVEMGEELPPEFDDMVDRLEAGQSPEEIESALPDLGGHDDGSARLDDDL